MGRRAVDRHAGGSFSARRRLSTVTPQRAIARGRSAAAEGMGTCPTSPLATDYRGPTLRGLLGRSGVGLSYLSEIERGRKPGSVTAWTRIAEAFGTTIDALVVD